MFGRGSLNAQTRRAEGCEEAEGEQEHRDDAIEEPREFDERHDTHLSGFRNPHQCEGVSYLNNVQIGTHLSGVKISIQRSVMNLW